jgi:hypothetical protein
MLANSAATGVVEGTRAARIELARLAWVRPPFSGRFGLRTVPLRATFAADAANHRLPCHPRNYYFVCEDSFRLGKLSDTSR